MEQIERDLNDIETNLAQLEKEGVELEKRLRSCEEGTLFLSLCNPLQQIFPHFLPFPRLDVPTELNVDASETSCAIFKINTPSDSLTLRQEVSMQWSILLSCSE